MNVIESSPSQRQMTKRRFWARQFGAEATSPQLVFDVAFGIVGPIICFAVDPIAFRGNIMGKPLFAEYQAFAYLFSAFEIVVLALWLTFGARLLFLNTLIGGILVGGAVFCAILGCLLAPYSLLGLMFLIGILGFTPFLTAIVYLRNGYRAVRARQHSTRGALHISPFLIGCLLALGGPALLGKAIKQVVSHSVEDIIHGDSRQASVAAHRLRPLSFLSGTELDRVVNEYLKEADTSRRQRLKTSYLEATGDDIEDKVRVIND